MRQTLYQRRFWIVAMIMLTLLLGGVFAWSPFNCWHEDVDINSGRIRRVRVFAFCKVRTQVEETWLSRALSTVPERTDWRRVNTFSPGMRYSAHYQFHDTIDQIKTLELLDDLSPFTQAERETIAKKMISQWQTGTDNEAAEFVRELSETRLASVR